MGRKKKELQLQPIAFNHIETKNKEPLGKRDSFYVSALVESISKEGLESPLVVQENGSAYQLVHGRRRLGALQEMGKAEIECMVIGSQFKNEVEVLEKFQKNQANPWELADCMLSLKKNCDWTQAHLGMALGKTRDFVANLLAITQITPEVRELILSDHRGLELTTRHLRYVGRARKSDQVTVAQRILENQVSTTILEREKRTTTPRNMEPNFIKVRELRNSKSGRVPRNLKEWRRYHRQLSTDLRRIDKQENENLLRLKNAINDARKGLSEIKKEANRKKRELSREMRTAMKILSRFDGY